MTIIFLRVSLVFHVTMFCCVTFCFMSVSCNNVLCHFSCDMFDIVSPLNHWMHQGKDNLWKSSALQNLHSSVPILILSVDKKYSICQNHHMQGLGNVFRCCKPFVKWQIFKKIKQICFILKSRLQSGGTYNWQWDKFMAKKKEIARQRQETNEWKS